MYEESISRELVYPDGISDRLLELGLQAVDITLEELIYADDLGDKYKQLSSCDRIALSIAKNREIILLTGDGALRNAAGNEGVDVMGTLGILDRLMKESKIDRRY